MVGDGRLSMGHARALIGAPDAEALAEDVARRGLSVRDTEKLGQGGESRRGRAGPIELGANADIVALERQLGDLSG